MAREVLFLFRLSKSIVVHKNITRFLHINSFKLSTISPINELKQQLKAENKTLKAQFPTTKCKEKVTKQDFTNSEHYFQLRNKVIEDLKAARKNPYLQKFEVSISLSDFINSYKSLNKNQILKDVTESVSGRVLSRRKSGTKLLFFDLLGEKAQIQVMVKADQYSSEEEFFDIVNKIQRGDIIGCKGHPYKTVNGELSILPFHLVLLAPCLEMLPHPHYGLKDNETQCRRRYLDFIYNASTDERIIARARINKYIRSYFDNLGFVEVETPIMHTISGGAMARPFVTYHNDLNSELFLRIAPELKLKEILIGRRDRVYEIGRQFRNESIDSSHNPEFTTCEFYEAYKDYNDLMKTIEILISGIVLKFHNTYKIPYSFENQDFEIDFTPPFVKISLLPALQEAMGDELPKPSEYHLPEANERLSYLCISHNVECPAPRTTKRLLDKLVGHFLETKFINPTILYDHPEIMSPLAKCHSDTPGLAERFELFIMKTEVVNAYTEENDPIVIRQRFQSQALDKAAGDEEAPPKDENFCKALDIGLKPCAGGGIGIDRLLMILSNASNIKEVLSFPAMRPESNKHESSER